MATPSSSKLADKIAAVQEGGETFISFEFFPPRTEKGVKNLYARLNRMKIQQPLFVDFTWGAGGSTSDLTLELAVRSQTEIGLEANMHLTCTNMDVSKIQGALSGAKEAGIRNILALRGDPPKGEEEWTATDSGFSCALDLIKYIKAEYGDYFNVSAACYPEGHPSVIKPVAEGQVLSPSEQLRLVTDAEGNQMVCSDEDFAAELAYVKAKVDAGATVLFTQMFFDVSVFTAFVDAARAIGITVPILPGIMILQAYGGFTRMTGFCKSRVPQALRDSLEAVKDDADAVKALGVQLGIKLCSDLLQYGVPGLHFYTLNQDKAVTAILEGLGRLRLPAAAAAAGGDAALADSYAMGRHTILSESYSTDKPPVTAPAGVEAPLPALAEAAEEENKEAGAEAEAAPAAAATAAE